jgi:hypothetical protein
MLVLDLNLGLRHTLHSNQHPGLKACRLLNILFEARAISLERLVRCEPLFASAFPLSCLILDHRLWPD